MNRTRRLAAAALLCSLVLGACGDDDGDDASTAATTTGAAAATTTAAPTTTTAAPTTTAAAADGGTTFPAGSPEAAAATAYRTVLDSTLGFDAKANFLEDAAALKATVESYTTAAARFGGFKVAPTAVAVTGTTAAVTYDVYFGTAKQYGDQKGTVTNVAGTWKVSRAEFCSFMQSARNPCPA